jgi:hypothetical protein
METTIEEKCPLLPGACGALTAKLNKAGFPAYHVGGFALDGIRLESLVWM